MKLEIFELSIYPIKKRALCLSFTLATKLHLFLHFGMLKKALN